MTATSETPKTRPARWMLGCLLALLFAASAQPAAASKTFSTALDAGATLATAAALPSGFVDEAVFTGLQAPSSLDFSPDGRVFVALLDGRIYVYDGVTDTTPTLFADLRRQVVTNGDRGIMGMTLDPRFTTGRPYVYVLYTYDAPIGGTAPVWNDVCPDPPGTTKDGCVVSGRLSRLDASGTETVLIKDEWCQQYDSHSVGDLHFGPDGALYATSGDGASYTFTDYGQDGSPVNPCGDPPGNAPGTVLTPPSAEGGALRSQDIRTSGDPTGLDGTMIRIDPDTGAPAAGNPTQTGDVNARRIVAAGLRNPFRWAFKPGTNDAYVGDVGWTRWEEINRIPNAGASVPNFGWPCYEGAARHSGYQGAGLTLCQNLYTAGTAAAPLYSYDHSARVADESCPTGTSSISAMGFYDGATFPAAYRGALFFGDYARGCIWVMFPGANGVPDPATRRVFVDGAGGPVDIETGPGGDLYYVDTFGEVRRIRALNPNLAPTARATATPPAGAAPLAVAFDGSGSTDPNGDTLSFAWDLDNDGAFDDATTAKPNWTYAAEGEFTARLRVTDPGGLSATATVTVTVGTKPKATITSPASGSTYAVGDAFSFSGSGAAADGTPIPASRLDWSLDLNHCSPINPSSCHVHHIRDFAATADGSSTYPDHEYPSHLTLTLTATGANGLKDSASVRIDPKTVDLTFRTAPEGLKLVVGADEGTTPFTRRVAQGSTVSVSAPTPQSASSGQYDFQSWSDGGAATHQLVAPAAAAELTATYAARPCPTPAGLVGAWGFDEAAGQTTADSSGAGNAGALNGATRTTGGRVGSALSFDGLDDRVVVADAASLDLTTGMTVEAWVNPTTLGSAWRTVALKEHASGLGYALYGNSDDGRPSGYVRTVGESAARGTAPLAVNAWSHLATTFDGSTLRLFVNGVQVSSSAVAGLIATSNGPLSLGGNGVWLNEGFAGRIDEVRVYDRALTAAQLQSDMAAPVTCGPAPAPVLAVSPASLAFTGTQGGAGPASKTLAVSNTGGGTLAWTASDDAPWLTVSPATGSGAATITATASTSGLAAGTYTATVTIAASGASGSPKTVPVTLTVDPPAPTPALAVSPSALSFTATQGGADPSSKTLAVSNGGGGTLSWAAAENAPWLAITPAGGSGAGTITVAPAIAGLAAGTYTTDVVVTADGATGSPATVPVTLTVQPAAPALSVTPASVSFTATQGGANPAPKTASVANTGGGTLTFSVSDDAAWLAVTPSSGTAPATLTLTPASSGLSPGTYTATVTVAAAGATGSPKTIGVTLTVAPPPSGGLVGAWGFDEASGTAAADASGSGNAGTIAGATRAAAGRYGAALSFDGVNDWVTVPDADSLDLTTGMTAEAWVNAAATGSAWRSVLLKEQPGNLLYALYAGNGTGRPATHVFTAGDLGTAGPAATPLNAWTHLASTYNGTTLRLFVNGTQVASRAVSGNLRTSTGPLRIGGNAVWPEWFRGLIDEVRVYNRALSAAEIQSDMARPVSGTGP